VHEPGVSGDVVEGGAGRNLDAATGQLLYQLQKIGMMTYVAGSDRGT